MRNQLVSENRAQLLKIFSNALKAVNGKVCVHRYLANSSLPTQDVHVLAIGKAAASMMQGAVDVLGARINTGLVVTKYQHVLPLPTHIRLIEAGHPVSDVNSLVAGQALIEFVHDCPADRTLLVLLSGGASALAEVLPSGMTLDQLAAVNQWLLSQPFSIHQINAVRKAISTIKGGKMLAHLHTPHCYQLILSDVPGNDLSVIGSGLFVANKKHEIDFVLPDWISTLIKEPHNGGMNQYEVDHHVVLADNQTLCQAVHTYAQAFGMVVRHENSMSGDAEHFAQKAVREIKHGEDGLYVWGGETYMKLPPSPGSGGRCQHIALSAATEFAGTDNVIFLAGASDGTDGPGDVAGALVDGQSIQRGEDAGLDALVCLQHADAGRFLEASGDLIDTGPTGTNVNDIVLALKWTQ